MLLTIVAGQRTSAIGTNQTTSDVLSSVADGVRPDMVPTA
jgi:hypothetical protein